MSRNVGSKDAITRGLIAALLAVLGVVAEVPGYLSFAAILMAIVLMATALTRECPIYRVFRIATLRQHQRRA